MELLKLLSANEIVAQVINFLILFMILRIFFWKRILKVLDERKEKIVSDLRSIDDAKNEVERLKAEYGQKLTSIEEIAASKIELAVKEGDQKASDIKKKAYQDADQIINAAKTEIKFEVAKAKEELRDQIVDLTIKATENMISEKLTEEDDRKLIEDFIKQIDEDK